MDSLQKALDQVLSDAPYQAVAEIIAKKLASRGVTLTACERRRLTEHLKSNRTDTFCFRKWQWWKNRAFAVEIASEEVEVLQGRFADFLEHQLPELIHSTVEDLSTEILKTLSRGWSAESRHKNRELQGFRRRLYQRWGEAIELLQMFLAISTEFGENLNAAFRSDPDPAQSHLMEALIRLHARACQVTEEIVCLLSAGLADGAMARWRTLHEIAVVALFLNEHGEDVAERYLDHQVVESFRAAGDYQQCCERLGYEPMSPSEITELQQAFEEVVKRYGEPFKTQYGWAAEALDYRQPTFSAIERAAGIDHFRAHYRMASHNVHANPKGVFFKLGLLDEVDVLLAGPSNAGLADPGHSTVISLLQISSALGLIKPTLDSLVVLQILAKVSDEVGEAFMEAHQRLEDDAGRLEQEKVPGTFSKFRRLFKKVIQRGRRLTGTS